MDRNEQGQGEGMASGEQSERLERLRGLIRRMDRTVDTTRDKRLGRVMVEPTASPASIPFPKASTPSTSGKPRAVAKSLQDFEAVFARLTDRQAG